MRQPSTTPNELAREVNAARPTASGSIATVTELYVRTRYGEEQLDSSELSRMREAVQQARRELTPPDPEPSEAPETPLPPTDTRPWPPVGRRVWDDDA